MGFIGKWIEGFMKSVIVCLALLALGMGSRPSSAASDVGILNQVAGTVTYQPAGGAPILATAFIKVRDGDRFNVAGGGSVRMIYFESGRQESWTGPAQFVAGIKESNAASGQPAITLLPTAAAQKLSLTPDMVLVAKSGRTGSVVVRGVTPKPSAAAEAAVREARATYAAMLPGSAPDDITPELYLVTVLNEYRLFDDMKGPVALMQKKQPQSEEARALAAWLGAKTH
jgi:hypothetical protein